MPTHLLLAAWGATAWGAVPADFAPVPSSTRRVAGLEDQPTDAESLDSPTPEATKSKRRDYLMQVNARVRYLTMPDSILDTWYYDQDDPGANDFKRPKVRGWTFGGEFVFDRGGPNYVLWGEYIHPQLDEGYWDDVDDDFVDHNDGDWVVPDGFGAGALGFTYLHELPLVDAGPEGESVGFSFVFGGGLGVLFAAGGLEYWQAGGNPDNTEIDCLPTAPSYERKDTCASEGYKRFPKVLPIVDLSLGFRLDFAEHAHLRIEGGVHDLLFLGAAAGGVF